MKCGGYGNAEGLSELQRDQPSLFPACSVFLLHLNIRFFLTFIIGSGNINVRKPAQTQIFKGVFRTKSDFSYIYSKVKILDPAAHGMGGPEGEQGSSREALCKQ